jgi:hypothetical protein
MNTDLNRSLTKEMQVYRTLSQFKSIIKPARNGGWYSVYGSNYRFYYAIFHKRLVFYNKYSDSSPGYLEDVWSELPEEFKIEVVYNLDILS